MVLRGRISFDVAGGGIDEREHETYECGLSCSRGTEYGGERAWLEVVGELLQHESALLVVAVVHVLESYAHRLVEHGRVVDVLLFQFFQLDESLG